MSTLLFLPIRMVNFRNTERTQLHRPVQYLSKRGQRKLLLLVMLAGLAIMAVRWAGNPANWQYFAGTMSEDANPAPAEQAPEHYDTRRRPAQPQTLPLDTFISPAEQPVTVDPSATFYPGVKPELLSSIRDFSPFRAQENAPWFNLLGVLKNASTKELEAASTGEVGFVQLYEQADIYRGQLITVSGVVKRAFDVQAPKNEEGIKKYYQLWLFPEGGPISPIVVYCLELPPDFPSSRDANGKVRNIRENVTLVGFGFKNWVYGAEQRIESAPLILAKNLDWHRPPPQEDTSLSSGTIGLIVAGTALFGLLFTIYVYVSSNRTGRSTDPTLSRFLPQSQREVEADPAEVGQTLKSLAEEVAAREASGEDSLDRLAESDATENDPPPPEENST